MECLKDFLVKGKVVAVAGGKSQVLVALECVLGKAANVTEHTVDQYLINEIELESGRVLIFNPHVFSNRFPDDVHTIDKVLSYFWETVKRESCYGVILSYIDIEITRERNPNLNTMIYRRVAKYFKVSLTGTTGQMLKDVGGLSGITYRLKKELVMLTIAGRTASGKSTLIRNLTAGMFQSNLELVKGYSFNEDECLKDDWLIHLFNRLGKIPLKIICLDNTFHEKLERSTLVLGVNFNPMLTHGDLRAVLETYIVPLLPSYLLDISFEGSLAEQMPPTTVLGKEEIVFGFHEVNIDNPRSKFHSLLRD